MTTTLSARAASEAAAHRTIIAASGRGTPRWLSKGAVNTALVLAAVYTFFPLVWMLLAASKSLSGLTSGVFNLQDWNLAGNLSRVFSTDGGIYLHWCLNSLLYAGGGSAVSALICIGAGYAFDKYEFPGKEKLFGLVLVGILVPSMVTVVPLYLLFSKLHLANTVWAVLVPSVVNPFGVYLARVFSAGYVPDEVMEAARIDGASDLRTFRSIGLPMLRSGFATVMLFQFSAIWNGFFLALVMLTNEKLYPLTLGVYMWSTQSPEDPTFTVLAITGAAVAILPLIVLFLCLQRYWRSGMTTGAVK